MMEVYLATGPVAGRTFAVQDELRRIVVTVPTYDHVDVTAFGDTEPAYVLGRQVDFNTVEYVMRRWPCGNPVRTTEGSIVFDCTGDL